MVYLGTPSSRIRNMKKKTPMTVSEMGKKGGKATLKKLGKEHYQRIAGIAHANRKKAEKK